MNNQKVAIFTAEGNIFSGLKEFNPKMVNKLKEIVERYNKMFAPMTFKVHRVLIVPKSAKNPKGYKKI